MGLGKYPLKVFLKIKESEEKKMSFLVWKTVSRRIS